MYHGHISLTKRDPHLSNTSHRPMTDWQLTCIVRQTVTSLRNIDLEGEVVFFCECQIETQRTPTHCRNFFWLARLSASGLLLILYFARNAKVAARGSTSRDKNLMQT